MNKQKNPNSFPGDDNESLLDDLEIDQSSQVSDDEEAKTEISKTKLDLIKKIVKNINESSEQLSNLLEGTVSEDVLKVNIGKTSDNVSSAQEEGGGQIIEGVFDGESMIGPDGKQYSIPANYASKSKLVEGDILKLTIADNGTFVYKQIGPIERKRVVGILEKGPGGGFLVGSEGKTWRVITASVTYYKGDVGDEVVIWFQSWVTVNGRRLRIL